MKRKPGMVLASNSISSQFGVMFCVATPGMAMPVFG